MRRWAKIVLFGAIAVMLVACGKENPTAAPTLNTDLRSDNMGAYLIREWEASLGELRFTNEHVDVWIDWQFLEAATLDDGRLQIDGAYDIEFTNATERAVGALLIRLTFRNARNGSVYEYVFDPERQLRVEPQAVLNVDGGFRVVVDDLVEAESIIGIEVGAQLTFARS